MSVVSDFLNQKGLKIIHKYANCHNLVYKVKDKDSNALIIKTNSTESSKKLLKNEVDWLKHKEYLENKLSIRVPELLDYTIYKSQPFITMQFIEGVSFLEKFRKEELDKDALLSLARFTQKIESIDYVETCRSEEKHELSGSKCDEIFNSNFKTWYTDIIQNASIQAKRIIKIIHDKSKGFSISNVGYAGIHGSPKLDEFIIDKNGNLYVVDWERASSVYINFYDTASVASHLLIKLKDSDSTQQYLYLRKQLLNKKNRDIWDKHFTKVLCQRMVGDLWDLSKRDELESVLELPIKEFIS